GRRSGLDVRFGIRVELGLAHRRAEVISLAVVHARRRRFLFVDGHLAHRIGHHTSSCPCDPVYCQWACLTPPTSTLRSRSWAAPAGGAGASRGGGPAPAGESRLDRATSGVRHRPLPGGPFPPARSTRRTTPELWPRLMSSCSPCRSGLLTRFSRSA